MAPLSRPSIFTIRTALEQIEGAIRLKPLPEGTAAGRDLGTPVLRFGGEEILEGARTLGLVDYDASSAPERPEVVFEVPPKVTRISEMAAGRSGLLS
jgi:hypothetical protein